MLDLGIASTVVKIENEQVIILTEGSITKSQIEEVIQGK